MLIEPEQSLALNRTFALYYNNLLWISYYTLRHMYLSARHSNLTSVRENKGGFLYDILTHLTRNSFVSKMKITFAGISVKKIK